MNIAGYNFTGPYDPTRGFTNTITAIYAIVDSKLSLVDVGQTEDLNNRFPNHPRQSCWEKHAGGVFRLYIWQESNEQKRLQIESVIRTQYNPPCGEK
jgi:hypothetical protein